jgi:hypothetical protein
MKVHLVGDYQEKIDIYIYFQREMKQIASRRCDCLLEWMPWAFLNYC